MVQSGPKHVLSTRQSIRIEEEWRHMLPLGDGATGNVVTVKNIAAAGGLYAMGIATDALKGQTMSMLQNTAGNSTVAGREYLITANSSIAGGPDTITLREYVQGASIWATEPAYVAAEWDSDSALGGGRLVCTSRNIRPGYIQMSADTGRYLPVHTLEEMLGVIDDADNPDPEHAITEQWTHTNGALSNMPGRWNKVYNQTKYETTYPMAAIIAKYFYHGFGEVIDYPYDTATGLIAITGVGTNLNRDIYPGEYEVISTALATPLFANDHIIVGDHTNLDDTEVRKLYHVNIALTMAAAGYTPCVVGDIGKAVVGVSTHTGLLISYDNATRIWIVNSPTGQFTDADACTITAGTGAGTVDGAGKRVWNLTVDKPFRIIHLDTGTDANCKVGETDVLCSDYTSATKYYIHKMRPQFTLDTTFHVGVTKEGETNMVDNWYLRYGGLFVPSLNFASTTSNELRCDFNVLGCGSYRDTTNTPPTLDESLMVVSSIPKDPMHWSRSKVEFSEADAGAYSEWFTCQDVSIGVNRDMASLWVHSYNTATEGLHMGRDAYAHIAGRATYNFNVSIPLDNIKMYDWLLTRKSLDARVTFDAVRSSAFTESWIFNVYNIPITSAPTRLPSEPVELQAISSPPDKVTLETHDKIPFYG